MREVVNIFNKHQELPLQWSHPGSGLKGHTRTGSELEGRDHGMKLSDSVEVTCRMSNDKNGLELGNI